MLVIKHNRIVFRRPLVSQFIQLYAIAHIWPLCKTVQQKRAAAKASV